jgi:class 3 adenylate cyclase
LEWDAGSVCADLTRDSGAGVVLPEGTVTVLFTDLVESTQLNQQHGDEVANDIRRAVENCALELVDRHRGVVVKGLGDGLMVAFQSARRAVACAREIQLAVASRNRDNPARRATMRIGLHTGEVITEDHDLHGETVIIAKRIEGVAPSGGIYASATVHGVLGTARAGLVDRGEFDLKGIDTPWHLYEVPVVDERSPGLLADSDRSPYVGRAQERDLLAQLVARAAGGRGAMVLVAGEAGAGKSRLVQETSDLARQHQMAVLVGHCLDMDAPPPYQPLVEQLGQAARALPPEVFRQVLGDNAPEVARLMPELHRIYPDIGDSPGIPPDQERQYLLHGFSRFVARATPRRPLVLCFEDLHWADEASLPFRLSQPSAEFFDEFAGRFGVIMAGRHTGDVVDACSGHGPLPGRRAVGADPQRPRQRPGKRSSLRLRHQRRRRCRQPGTDRGWRERCRHHGISRGAAGPGGGAARRAHRAPGARTTRRRGEASRRCRSRSPVYTRSSDKTPLSVPLRLPSDTGVAAIRLVRTPARTPSTASSAR